MVQKYSSEYKKAEIETYSRKVKKGRPDWGEQWDKEAMEHLLQIGDKLAIQKYFSKYFVGTCLIIGVGAGGDASRLKNIVEYVIGIDIAKPQIMKSKRNKLNSCDFILCDAEFLPFRNNSFTSILCKATLHHIPDTYGVLTEIFRIMSKEATLVLLEPWALNPMACIGRKFSPTNIHTEGERPFIPFVLKKQVELRFHVINTSYYYFVSNILPVLYKNIPSYLKKLKIIDSLYHFDQLLMKTPFRQLCWVFIIVAKKF